MEKLTAQEIRGFIGKPISVIMDQPLGSSYWGHGEEVVYAVNYGFVPETLSGDGEELDAYVLGVQTPLKTFTGRCIAVIHRLNDDDDKLVVVPEGMEFGDAEIQRLTYFQERFFVSEIWR